MTKPITAGAALRRLLQEMPPGTLELSIEVVVTDDRITLRRVTTDDGGGDADRQLERRVEHTIRHGDAAALYDAGNRLRGCIDDPHTGFRQRERSLALLARVENRMRALLESRRRERATTPQRRRSDSDDGIQR